MEGGLQGQQGGQDELLASRMKAAGKLRFEQLAELAQERLHFSRRHIQLGEAAAVVIDLFEKAAERPEARQGGGGDGQKRAGLRGSVRALAEDRAEAAVQARGEGGDGAGQTHRVAARCRSEERVGHNVGHSWVGEQEASR